MQTLFEMSASKGAVLRIIAPKDSFNKVLASLGPSAKTESWNSVLEGGRQTTDEIVKNIRDYTRLRDELLHAIRQLGVARESKARELEPQDYSDRFSETQKQLQAYRGQYQELQSRIEALGRELEEIKKQQARLAELAETGFGLGEVAPRGGEFARILGRMPARRLEDAQRTLENTFEGQAVLATGRKSKDWVFVLLAVQPDKTSQALQTVMLYDFVQTEVPKSEEPDLEQARALLETKRLNLSNELESVSDRMKVLQEEARETLNRLADVMQDSLMTLRGVLKLGEGSTAVQAFSWLQKPLNPKTLETLSSVGALYEIE